MTYTQDESYYKLDTVDAHYTESFILPAAVGPYVIRPFDGVAPCATLTAFIRGTELSPAIPGLALPATTWAPG